MTRCYVVKLHSLYNIVFVCLLNITYIPDRVRNRASSSTGSTSSETHPDMMPSNADFEDPTGPIPDGNDKFNY